ncbi:hypothetical protein SD78_1890 [Bacillus badius]|nr:hypothetical protein SD78_1890 [Bacillus badius]
MLMYPLNLIKMLLKKNNFPEESIANSFQSTTQSSFFIIFQDYRNK